MICAADIGPHLHRIRHDGSLSILVITPDQYDQFVINESSDSKEEDWQTSSDRDSDELG